MADRIESKILLFHQSADCPGVIVGERGAYGCADAETDFRWRTGRARRWSEAL